jgi:prolipoprotein diacylglyceryl transferase
MTSLHHMPLSYLPSPPANGFHVGPLFIHFYGLMYVIGITLAVIITQRRVRGYGGDPGVVADVALWAVPAGIIGGRIYFDLTTPSQIPHVWYGAFAVWSGGLGIWGGIAAGALAGIWRLRRRGIAVAPFADAIAPALLVAQAVGRIGNYFNQELYGKRTGLPWGLLIHGRPGAYQPTFLYELIWDLALAALLVWLGHHTRIRPPGLFALYVTGYSAFRIYEESLRIDYSQHFFHLRLNTFVASGLTLIGIVWFAYTQRPRPEAPALPADSSDADTRAAPSNSATASAADAAEGSEAESDAAPAPAEVKTGTDEDAGAPRDTSGRRA